MISSDSPKLEIKVVPDAKGVAAEAAERLTAAAERAIAERGRFSIALSGGSTPKALYALLTAEPYRSRIDWSKVHVLFGDERAVPPDHKDSNFKMAEEALLSKVPIPKGQVYRMKGELGDKADQAAKEYGQMLKEKFGDGGIDLILLGMGDDGHTASLFPNTEALRETKHRCVANFVPKLKTWRITLSAPFINQSKRVLILLAGAEKAQRLQEVLEGPRDPDRLPIQRIEPKNGQLVWMVDAGAAGMQE
jgi:6-phosphogluconolactonase